MNNSFGHLFRITTFGESHGPGIGVVIDGCPPGIAFDLDFIEAQLRRRRPGASSYVTPRRESDRLEVWSGVQEGRTLGTPIALWIANQNVRSEDYAPLRDVYRPSHADFTYEAKYGRRDWRGGGRASGRETAARVAAGAVAMLLLRQQADISIQAYTAQVGPYRLPETPLTYASEAIDASPLRCPDPVMSEKMAELVQQVQQEGDSIGGTVRCVIRGVPAGLGEPVFDKMEALLAHAMLSIPAAKGFEIGGGFSLAAMRGSEANDAFYRDEATGNIRTRTNWSGGVQGGISNGMPVYFQVAFKPPSSIRKKQMTVNKAGEPVEVKVKGRHDPCIVPRAVPVVEAMAALVTADLWLRRQAIRPVRG